MAESSRDGEATGSTGSTPATSDARDSMLAAIPAAAAFLDGEGRLLRFNAAWSRGAGRGGLCRPEAGTAFPPADYGDEDARARVAVLVNAVMAGEHTVLAEDLSCGCSVRIGACAAGGALVVVTSPADGAVGVAAPPPPSLIRIQEALTALSRSDLLAEGGLDAALGGITKAAAHTVAAERAGVWLFEDDGARIVCRSLYLRGLGEWAPGPVVEARGHEQWYEAIRSQRHVRCDDARRDPRTREWDEEYLGPLDIRSLVHAPVRSRGRVVGFLSLEHVGGPRTWTAEEEVFAASLADVAAGVLDSHDRLRMEQELRDRDARFHEFVNRTAEAIFCLECMPPVAMSLPSKDQATRLFDTVVTECNDALALFFGHTDASRVEGQRFRALAGVEHDTWRSLFESFVRGGHRLVGEECETAGPDGGRRWLRCHAAGVVEGGRLLRLIGTLQDITGEKLLREQLQKSQRLESIGRLAGGVAHDFNNLLSVILGYSELAAERLAPGHPAERALEQVRLASERAAGLTRQLLTFARRQFVEPEVVDINARIEGVSELLRRVLGEDIEMHTRLQAGLWAVRVDPGQFEQVLLNLAVNARDAMPEGGTLTITSSNAVVDEADPRPDADMQPGEWVRVDVRDTGIGMDEETMSHVFEPFFTTKAASSGTGLGLATCHGIVSQSGGHIGAWSRPGRGARITVFLPRVHAAVTQSTFSDHRLADRGDETILLVEDEDAVRALATEALEERGYRVLAAPSAEKALQVAAAEGQRIDLLLSDVVLPGMNGPALAERLREERPELRVLFVSGYAEDTFAGKGILEVGARLLAKPFAPSLLARRVRERLDVAPGEIRGEGIL